MSDLPDKTGPTLLQTHSIRGPIKEYLTWLVLDFSEEVTRRVVREFLDQIKGLFSTEDAIRIGEEVHQRVSDEVDSAATRVVDELTESLAPERTRLLRLLGSSKHRAKVRWNGPQVQIELTRSGKNVCVIDFNGDSIVYRARDVISLGQFILDLVARKKSSADDTLFRLRTGDSPVRKLYDRAYYDYYKPNKDKRRKHYTHSKALEEANRDYRIIDPEADDWNNKFDTYLNGFRKYIYDHKNDIRVTWFEL